MRTGMFLVRELSYVADPYSIPIMPLCREQSGNDTIHLRVCVGRTAG